MFSEHNGWAKLSNRIPDTQAMTGARYANVLQHLIVELPEQINLDIVSLKRIGILGETKRLQPFAHLAHGPSCSSSVLALQL